MPIPLIENETRTHLAIWIELPEQIGDYCLYCPCCAKKIRTERKAYRPLPGELVTVPMDDGCWMYVGIEKK